MALAYRRLYGWNGTDWEEIWVDGDANALVVTDHKHPDVLFEYTGGVLDYKGVHTSHDPGTDDEGWTIYKFTWDGNDLVRLEKLTGAWDNRATLDWGV